MPKEDILTGKELVINILKYGIIIFIIISLIHLFFPGFTSPPGRISLFDIGIWWLFLEYILFFILIWFSLKRVDKLNKLFNKYTLASGILICYILLNLIVNYILTQDFDFGVGILPIIINLLIAKFTKLKNHRNDFDILMREKH